MTTQVRMLPAVAAVLLLTAASSWGQEEAQERPREDQEARARHRFIQRADERGEIAPNALVNAKKELDLRASLQRVDGRTETAGISSWEWLGPGNVGGRIRSILIHPTNPTTMWIGSVSGGIWRTDNGGASWAPVNDFMSNLAITSLAMDPLNPSIMYAATGEGFSNADAISGAGIFKSVDGGITWSQLPATQGWTFVNRLAHHPDSSGVILAAVASPQGVWKTTNGGTTWRQVQFTPDPATDVKYHPTFANRVMVGTGRTYFSTIPPTYVGDVYSSTNYGTTWVLQTTGAPGKLPADGGRCEVAFSPSAVDPVYVSMDRNGGEIWSGVSGGSNWTLRSTGTSFLGDQGWYDNVLWVDPQNSSILVVGGIGLYRSIDGGSTLTNIYSLHADQHSIVPHPGYDGSTNLAVFVGHDGGIQRTNNIRTAAAATDWTELNNNLGITQFYGGATAPAGDFIAGGTQDNGQIHYWAAGGTEGWGNQAFGDGGFAAVDQTTPARVYGEYIFLRFFRSDDGGQSYSQRTAGLGDASNDNLALFIAPFSMDPNNSSVLVAGGKRIWRTVNRADDWTRIRDSLPSREKCSAIDIAKGNSATVWVGYELGTVSYTTNTGSTWANVDGPIPNRYVTDIAINPFNSDEVFVTIGGYSGDQVWLTTDRGVTWTDRTGTFPFDIPSVQVNTVRYHPGNPNWVYVGSDLGVFASENKGLHWRVLPAYPGNDGPANVAVDELFWQGGEALIAATHGRGMYRAQLGIYVAGDSPTPPGTGTQANPFTLVQLGINAMGNGEPLIFAPWDYQQGPLTFNRRGWLVAPNGAVTIR